MKVKSKAFPSDQSKIACATPCHGGGHCRRRGAASRIFIPSPNKMHVICKEMSMQRKKVGEGNMK